MISQFAAVSFSVHLGCNDLAIFRHAPNLHSCEKHVLLFSDLIPVWNFVHLKLLRCAADVCCKSEYAGSLSYFFKFQWTMSLFHYSKLTSSHLLDPNDPLTEMSSSVIWQEIIRSCQQSNKMPVQRCGLGDHNYGQWILNNAARNPYALGVLWCTW